MAEPYKDRGEKGDGAPKHDRDAVRTRIVRTVAVIFAVLGACGAIVSVVLYAFYRNDVMFIPAALCAVVAIIAFTYAVNSKRY